MRHALMLSLNAAVVNFATQGYCEARFDDGDAP